MDNDACRDFLEIGFKAPLAFKLLSKRGFRKAISKARHDATCDVDPTLGAESQREVSGDGAEQGTEHIERSAADITITFERGLSDCWGITIWHGHTIEDGQRTIEVRKAGSGQKPLHRHMLEVLAQMIDDALFAF